MEYDKVKHYCNSIIHLVDRMEKTNQKEEMNEIEIGIDRYKELLMEELEWNTIKNYVIVLLVNVSVLRVMKRGKKMELTNKEKDTLLQALDCLIDKQGDTINHTELYNKLRKWK